MKIYLFFLTILLTEIVGFSSCDHTVSTDMNGSARDSLKNRIIGYWGGMGEDSPVWEITADSIYYFNVKTSYPYKLFQDSLVISFPDHSASLPFITVISDTIKWKNIFGSSMYGYRFARFLLPYILRGKLFRSYRHFVNMEEFLSYKLCRIKLS